MARKSVYVLINGNTVVLPSEEACPWTTSALAYAVTVLDDSAFGRVVRDCFLASRPDNRRSIA